MFYMEHAPARFRQTIEVLRLSERQSQRVIDRDVPAGQQSGFGMARVIGILVADHDGVCLDRAWVVDCLYPKLLGQGRGAVRIARKADQCRVAPGREFAGPDSSDPTGSQYYYANGA